MGADSKIQWTDHTFNPWRGCSKVHTGCANCYAETLSNRNPGTLGVWGKDGTRVLASAAMWREPIKWNRQAHDAQAWASTYSKVDAPRPRVFCASLADVFEDWTGPMSDSKGGVAVDRDQSTLRMNDARKMLFDLIDATPNLDWLLLTKRPENVLRMWPTIFGNQRHNVWLGTSISDQATADKAVPELLKCRDLSPVLFLSAEPLVGPVDLLYPPSLFPDGPRYCCNGRECGCAGMPVDPWPWFYPRGEGIDWVIVGGESGHGARSYCTEWAASIIDQCKAAGAPVFHKQLGAMPFTLNKPHGWPDGTSFSKEYHNVFGDCWLATLKDAKGGDMSEWPESLRVREFPAVVPA